MKLGVDVLLSDKGLLNSIKGQRLGLVAHPASVTSSLQHSLNALVLAGANVTIAYGPQHGMRGEKQDNMIESSDYYDPELKIPVVSLYGTSRRPTSESLDQFDICLFDLQDVGTRIYTFLTTLRYVMEGCASKRKKLWILDRPNPAGRPIEGLLLRPGWESFVGAGPVPMRHGLTMGEAAKWFKEFLQLDLELKIIQMEDYQINAAPFFGWPQNLSWVNPSPNAANHIMAKAFPGTVMIEGTHLSEGRGTTHPLELVGASDIDILRVLSKMESLQSNWMKGCVLRPCFFEPTFHKHEKKLCQGFQIHLDHPSYRHDQFKPFRLVCLFLKAVRTIYPHYNIWRDFPYEYEVDRLAFDLIHGGPRIREWIDDSASAPEDLEKELVRDEGEWKEKISKFLLYS